MISRGRGMSTSTPPSTSAENTMEVSGLTEARGTLRQQDKETRAKVPAQALVKLSPKYQYRESNWSIGRTAERAGVKVRVYKRGDRFLAWRKREEGKKRSAEKRSLSSRKKKGSSKK